MIISDTLSVVFEENDLKQSIEEVIELLEP